MSSLASTDASSSARSEKLDDIRFEVVDQVAWITIDRPRYLNAFREHTLDEMVRALRTVRHDPSIVAVVVTGEGDRAFSAGGDFHAMMRLNNRNGHLWNERMLETAMTIRGLHVPVIAMVNGFCMGGGNELALWCDVVIASENAVFGQTGAKVGACPTVGATQYLPRIVGERIAREMIFFARTLDADEALRYGLANKVVPLEELRAATLEWCERLKGHSSQTIRATKTSLNHESDDLYASWRHGMELLNNIWGSEECLEGMTAFLERRPPDFQRFRLANRDDVSSYLDGLARGENQHPDARGG
jgi:dihydroxynaphthoic acid synthetase